MGGKDCEGGKEKMDGHRQTKSLPEVISHQKCRLTYMNITCSVMYTCTLYASLNKLLHPNDSQLLKPLQH